MSKRESHDWSSVFRRSTGSKVGSSWLEARNAHILAVTWLRVREDSTRTCAVESGNASRKSSVAWTEVSQLPCGRQSESDLASGQRRLITRRKLQRDFRCCAGEEESHYGVTQDVYFENSTNSTEV